MMAVTFKLPNKNVRLEEIPNVLAIKVPRNIRSSFEELQSKLGKPARKEELRGEATAWKEVNKKRTNACNKVGNIDYEESKNHPNYAYSIVNAAKSGYNPYGHKVKILLDNGVQNSWNLYRE